jgi:hypothetical protein
MVAHAYIQGVEIMQTLEKKKAGAGHQPSTGFTIERKKSSISSSQYHHTTKKANINHAHYLRRIVDYSNLSIGATDIDLITEWRGLAFIIGELKYADTPIPTGQRLTLERMADAFQDAGKQAIVCRISHGHEINQIDAAAGTVTEWYYNHRWKKAPAGRVILFGEMQERFINKIQAQYQGGGA